MKRRAGVERVSRTLFAFTLLGLVLGALGAPSANAIYDPIDSGSAKLSLDPSFAKLLGRNGVKLKARGPAKVSGRVATLPVAGGKADPTIKKAQIDLGGELIFATAKRSVPLTKITLKTKRTPFFAKVGGGQLKVAGAAKVALEREGFGNRLSATGLRLTAKLAMRLNKRLQLEVFKEGQKLGTLSAACQPLTVAVLPSGVASLAVDPPMAAKLKALSTSLNPLFPAELAAGPVLKLPIAIEGQIAPDGKGGTLRSGGGVELLRLGAGQLFWQELWFDLAARTATAELQLQPTPKFPGKLGRTPVLDFATTTIVSDPLARTVTLAGAPVTLPAQSAAQFNEAFAEGKPQFAAGELLGVLTFTAQTQ